MRCDPETTEGGEWADPRIQKGVTRAEKEWRSQNRTQRELKICNQPPDLSLTVAGKLAQMALLCKDLMLNFKSSKSPQWPYVMVRPLTMKLKFVLSIKESSFSAEMGQQFHIFLWSGPPYPYGQSAAKSCPGTKPPSLSGQLYLLICLSLHEFVF